MNRKDWQITNANLVIPGQNDSPGGCLISRGKIDRILGPGEEEAELLNLNLHGLSIYPGLINAHDSLLASYHAFPGENRPYFNWLAWDNDLKSSPLFRERMLLEVEDLYRLGAYRNLLSGVTTVVDHIPHFVRESAPEELPVGLLTRFGISHSIGSYSLDWGDGVALEYTRALKEGLPYITHIAEGFDRESKESLQNLIKEGGLGANTVLVHGLSLSEQDLRKIADAGASLVWCPASNLLLYEQTTPVQKARELGISISLGSDSAMSGSSGLLADLAAAAGYRNEMGIQGLDDLEIVKMATENPARDLKLEGRGKLAEDYAADLLVLKGKDPRNPLRSLIQADPEDIYLVVRQGVPLYGDAGLEIIFTEMGVLFDRIKIGKTDKLIIKGIKKLLDSITATVGTYREFEFLPLRF